MSTSINSLALEVYMVANALFPRRTDASMLFKLYEEIGEVVKDTNDPDEVADVFILWLDFAARKGMDIEAAVRKKLATLEERQWALNPVTNVYHHVEQK